VRRRLTFFTLICFSLKALNISRIDVFDDIVKKIIHLMVVVKYFFNIVIFVEKDWCKNLIFAPHIFLQFAYSCYFILGSIQFLFCSWFGILEKLIRFYKWQAQQVTVLAMLELCSK
jgi:hypothetical protein